ncbi:MAG: tetratricopeptide repeat protein [Okeania sp. SIO3B5]|uniref:tetratricopeptide repeat protein n=1 Tax=Okeania sp. SIO3B5 TaxID=2607811 RepID=UPI0013FEDB27|nr:tetratricopeptide repeat protein [Okeania sp. SIO3B5]NEO52825.1 tetratricopeptide repeat protein [Okeania sp. SIO3B5]
MTIVNVLAKPLSSVIPGFNLLISFSPPGQVKLKREQWQTYQPTTVGTRLRDADRLFLPKGAKAKVICQNLVMWKVPAGKESIVREGCPSVSNPRLIDQGEDTAPTRNPNTPSIPYLISPRETKLLPTESVTFHWHQVEGAKNYRVSLRGPGVNWNDKTKENQVVYAAEQPLKPGTRYWFTVETDTGATSTREGIIGFSTVSEKEVQEILGAVEEVKQKQLSREAEALALARLYQSNEVYNEAIALLKSAIKDGVESTAIHQLLGKVYQQIGLNRLAREHYLKALELAKAEENLEGLAMTQGGLAITNGIVGNEDEARNYFKNAKATYQELGDEEAIRNLEKVLTEILGVNQGSQKSKVKS